MSESIYLQDLREIPKTIDYQILDTKYREPFKELRERSRSILESVCGIPRTKTLVVYGEQADPPIIKNSGKAFLSAII